MPRRKKLEPVDQVDVPVADEAVAAEAVAAEALADGNGQIDGSLRDLKDPQFINAWGPIYPVAGEDEQEELELRAVAAARAAEQEKNEEEPDEAEELSLDEIYSQEIDMGEYAEIEKTLVVPEGKYLTTSSFSFTVTQQELRVIGRTGRVRNVKRHLNRFWGEVIPVTGVSDHKIMLGFSVSPMVLFTVRAGDRATYYDHVVDGSRMDSPSRFFHQAIKLFKRRNKRNPGPYAELIEFLRDNPLRLTNRVFGGEDDDDREVTNFVVGFNLVGYEN